MPVVNVLLPVHTWHMFFHLPCPRRQGRALQGRELSKVARPRPRPRRAAPVRAPSSSDFRAAWRPGPRRALLGHTPVVRLQGCLPTARGTRRRTTATATAAAGIPSRRRLILTEVAAAAGGVAVLLEFLLHVRPNEGVQHQAEVVSLLCKPPVNAAGLRSWWCGACPATTPGRSPGTPAPTSPC